MGTSQHIIANLRTIDLNRISVFVAVVDASSFTLAAAALGMPKSSVSRAVSQLEAELGVVLLTRTTRKLSLTEAGKLYAERAREALSVLAGARANLLEADHEPRGLVRITAPTDPSGSMLAGSIARFCALYPQIQIEVVFSGRRVDLIEQGIDLALRAGRLDDATLVGKRIGLTPSRLVASPDYLERRGTPRRVADLARHDCLLFRGVGGVQRWTLSRGDRSESIEVRGPVNVDELSFVLPLSIHGLGIALVPTMMSTDAVRRGSLVYVLPKYEQRGAALHLLHPAARTLPRRVVLFRDFLYSELRTYFSADQG